MVITHGASYASAQRARRTMKSTALNGHHGTDGIEMQFSMITLLT
jgi:hypothetical protein